MRRRRWVRKNLTRVSPYATACTQPRRSGWARAVSSSPPITPWVNAYGTWPTSALSLAAGGNYKLSEYHAAVGLAQFNRLPLLQKRRELLRKRYQEASEALTPHFSFQTLPDNYWGQAPVIPLRDTRFYGAAALCLKPHVKAEMAFIVQFLADKGVQTRRWYCPGLHHHPAFAHVETHGVQGDHRMPVTEVLQQRVVGIPYHNMLRLCDIRHVIGSVLASVEDQRITIDAI